MTTPKPADQTVYLNEVFDKIEAADTMVNANIASTFNTMEIYLDCLKELHRLLDNDKVLTKADAIRLIMRVRKIYTGLETWEQVAHVWVKFRDNLNNTSIVYHNKIMAKDLLIYDNSIILNRTIFSGKRRLETLRRLGPSSLPAR